MLAIGLAFAFSLDKAWSRRNRLKHQIPIGMRLVKAKKNVGSALHARGQKALCYRKRQQRTAQNERRKGKVPEADAPNVENQEGGGCLGRLKTMELDGPGTSITLSTNILQ